MPKDKINNLNDLLFAQLERLDDEDLTDEQLDKEVKRASAITDISDKLLTSAKLSLDAAKLINEYGRDASIPVIFTEKHEEQKKIADK